MECDQPRGSGERNYEGLIDLLPQLSLVPDGLGETDLTEDEAAQIRALGFPATQGEWFAPPLPNILVMGDGLLECLSDAWEEDVDPRRLLPQQSEGRPEEVEEDESVDLDNHIWSKDEVRVFEALQRAGRWVKRRRLQKNLWRLGARRFNEGLSSLQKSGVLELTGSMVRLTMTETGKETRHLSANLQTPGNATLLQPVETVSVHRKDRRSERLTG